MSIGLELMLKSFGIDANEMKKQGKDLAEGLREFSLAIKRIEQRQLIIMDHLDIRTPAPADETASKSIQ